MTLTIEPADLGAVAEEFRRLDWDLVWTGYSAQNPEPWCRQLGWEPDHLDRASNLFARTASGPAVFVRRQRPFQRQSGVAGLSLEVWRASAPRPANNPALFERGERAWREFEAEVLGSLGDPSINVTWDDPDFPQDLASRFPADTRVQRKEPLHLARWSLPGATFELLMMPSIGLASDDESGTIILSARGKPVACLPPEAP